MTTTDLHGALEALRKIESAVVVSHTNPDGDSVGASLGMTHLLRSLGKNHVRCVQDDPTPQIYRWLPGNDETIRSENVEDDFQTLVVVDVAQLDRIGKMGERDLSSKEIIVIDHHLTEEPEGTVNFVDSTYSSTGEIIADLYEIAGISITKEAAVCIFVALTTDTGGFRFANTNARSHVIAARLLETGIDVADVSDRVFNTMSEAKFHLLRRVLDRMVIESDLGIAHSKVLAGDLEDVKAEPEDIEGLVNYTRNIRGIRVGILFREIDAENTKVSMRTQGVFNAAEFLSEFGGGGHAGAAGATVNKPLEEVEQQVLSRLRASLGESS